jgi:hypothetical protein
VAEFYCYDPAPADGYRREVDNGDPAAVVPDGVAGQAIGRAAVPETAGGGES